MKSYLKLSLLLLSALLLTARCEEEGEGDLSDEDEGELDGDQEMDLAKDDDLEPGEEGEEGAEGEEGDESWQSEKKTPLTLEQMHALHKKIDAKGTGKVSIADATEFANKMRRSFARKQLHDDMEQMDTDKDVKVSLEEFIAHFQKNADDEEQNAGPTKEEQEEFLEEQKKEFKVSDKNNDGLLDVEELAYMHHHYISDKVETEMTKGAMKERDTDSNGELTPKEFFEMEDTELTEEDTEVFSKLDKDGSGTLSHAEFVPWLTTGFDSAETVKNLFASADKDDDGLLTAEELAGAREDIANDDHQLHLFLHEWHEGHGKHEL